MSNTSAWSTRWFGFWSEYGPAYSQCPSIVEFRRPEFWQGVDREPYAHYLETAHALAAASRMDFACAISGRRFGGSICYRTDGTWLWLDDLGYYVREFSVAIPNEMRRHIELLRYQPPLVTEQEVAALQWPPLLKGRS